MNSSSTIRRRNSMASAVVPSDLYIPMNQKQSSSFPGDGFVHHNDNKPSFPTVDFELISLKSPSMAYTSLKDLMAISPSSVQSPTGYCNPFSYEIPIKNRLVKQAAWAYLQPMSTSPCSSNHQSFQRLWIKFSRDYVRNPVNSCISFINHRVIPTISRLFDRLLGAIRVRINSNRRPIGVVLRSEWSEFTKQL